MSLRQNALLLVLLTALIAVLGQWSGDAWLGRGWLAPLGLLLLGLAYEAALAQRTHLMLYVRASVQWLLCRPTPLGLEVSRSGGRAATLELAPAAPSGVALDRTVAVVRLPADGAGTLESSGSARRLGRFHWPALRVRLSGALDLAWWSRSLQAPFEFEVVPDIVRADERAHEARAGGARSALQTGTGGEILQLRDYRPGDPPRAIDWKASARTRRMISRDFAEDQHLEIIIALDISRASGLAAGLSDRLALNVNVAARLAQRAALLDDRVGLLLYADQPLAAMPPGRGVAAVSRLRSLLAQARVQPTDSNPALAAMRIRALARQRSMVLLLTDLDDAAMAPALIGAARLLMPKHLPFIAGVASEAAQQLSRRAAGDDLEVYESLAAQRYCSGLARNLKALRALGAACVIAAPDALDAAVLEAYLSFRRRRRV